MRNFKRPILLVLLLALILRLSLIFVAYHGDLNNNISWGTIAAEAGLDGFYEGEGLSSVALRSEHSGSKTLVKDEWPYSAPNQPPLTILMFSGLRLIWLTIEKLSWWLNNNFRVFPSPFIWFWEARGMVLLVKLPSVLADLGIGWMIYQYLNQKSRIKNQKEKALLLSSIWLFNPVTWYNSSVWGQTDSIVNLLGLVAVFAILNKNLIKFAVFITLSLLFKGSLIVFTPILFTLALIQKQSVKQWFKSVIYSLAVITLISVWFHPHTDLHAWLFNLYKERILPGEIGYLTANAFNFWWLVNPGKVLDSTVYFGLPARVWGFLIVAGTVAGLIYWLGKKKITDKRIFFSLIVLSLVSFLFLTRIHERYLYPFFPLATILLGLTPGLVIAYITLSLTHLLNLYHLFWAPAFPFLEKLFTKSLFPQSLALINILFFIYLLRHFRTLKL